MHAVDRFGRIEEGMERLQHEAIAAKRHDDVGFRSGIAVELAQSARVLLGLRRLDATK